MPSAIPCSLSLLIPRIHIYFFSDWKRIASSKFFDTQVPSISFENLCSLDMLAVPSLVFDATDTAFCSVLSSYLSRIGRIENPFGSAYEHQSQDISHLILHCAAKEFCVARSLATLCLSTTSGPVPGEFPSFWSSMVFHHAPIPWKESGNNNRKICLPLSKFCFCLR